MSVYNSIITERQIPIDSSLSETRLAQVLWDYALDTLDYHLIKLIEKNGRPKTVLDSTKALELCERSIATKNWVFLRWVVIHGVIDKSLQHHYMKIYLKQSQ